MTGVIKTYKFDYKVDRTLTSSTWTSSTWSLEHGLTGLCITKLDVLDGLAELKICNSYRLDGKVIDLLPIGADEVARCEPIYETMPGWSETTFGAKRWEDLPANAQAYLNRLELLCQVPIAIVSTGPERDETILRQHPFN